MYVVATIYITITRRLEKKCETDHLEFSLFLSKDFFLSCDTQIAIKSNTIIHENFKTHTIFLRTKRGIPRTIHKFTLTYLFNRQLTVRHEHLNNFKRTKTNTPKFSNIIFDTRMRTKTHLNKYTIKEHACRTSYVLF